MPFPSAGNQQDSYRIAQTSFKFTLSRKFELFLCISYYRIGHNFSDSFLDILSAVLITCCVPKTCKENLIRKAHQHAMHTFSISLSFHACSITMFM